MKAMPERCRQMFDKIQHTTCISLHTSCRHHFQMSQLSDHGNLCFLFCLSLLERRNKKKSLKKPCDKSKINRLERWDEVIPTWRFNKASSVIGIVPPLLYFGSTYFLIIFSNDTIWLIRTNKSFVSIQPHLPSRVLFFPPPYFLF